MNNQTYSKANPINAGSPIASITLPAIKYKSGKRIWYAITLPYRVLGKFIHTSSAKKKNKEIIQSEIRNRFLDTTHKNEIKDYIITEEQFTIPPITLTSFEELDFRPYTFGDETEEELNIRFESVGSMAGLVILPIDYEFECLDGNHRAVAIRELAVESAEEIADSSILLNIVYEKSTRKIRQDFVDVNQNAKQTSSSINTLFNTRDKVSNIVVDLIDDIEYLKQTTELLSTSVSKNSNNIFTINNLKSAVMEIAGYNSQSTKSLKVSMILANDVNLKETVGRNTALFFKELEDNKYIADILNHLQSKNPSDIPAIRNNNVLTSGTGIIVASRVAGTFIKVAQNETQLKEYFRKIAQFDWNRNSYVFVNNIIGDENKILNSRDAISFATKAVLNALGYRMEINTSEEE
ncbi:DGQHR domain-containing protein [Paenisporosarcina sp. HGH0030]|uniref:DNA sulfur modification protein DndB n=1 Tax=Paenisporosarcina sp. HGH0030 TaxID=1078085 RepID=UPI00034E8203|nr:DNA sulfur modification protein DndB [Paenisporosarcina sp. HGH0030]EPD50315.1 DGQHR domain-containing protein [Paenisporosarcina sp. HGH0030]